MYQITEQQEEKKIVISMNAGIEFELRRINEKAYQGEFEEENDPQIKKQQDERWNKMDEALQQWIK